MLFIVGPTAVCPYQETRSSENLNRHGTEWSEKCDSLKFRLFPMIISTLAFIFASVCAETAVYELYNTTGGFEGFYVENKTPSLVNFQMSITLS